MVEDLFRSLVLLMRCLPGLLVGSGIVFGFLCATASETTAQLSLDLAEAVSSADDPTRVPDLAGLPLVVSDGFRVWRDEMPDGCNSLPTILSMPTCLIVGWTGREIDIRQMTSLDPQATGSSPGY